MSGLTVNGFLGKRLPQIKAELEAEFRAQFGVDLNFAPETVIGQLVGIESEARSVTWAELEDVYQSQYPSTASGAALDLLVAINGLTRLPARATAATGYLSLLEGTLVAAGRRAKDGDNVYDLLGDVTGSSAQSHGAEVAVDTVADSTLYTVTVGAATYGYTSGIGATGQSILSGVQSALPPEITSVLSASSLSMSYDGPSGVSVSANMIIENVVNVGSFQGVTTGPISLPVGALDEIETPVAGWVSVTNRDAGTLGNNVETDGELRVRRDVSVRLSAISTVDGITAQLLETFGVLDAVVIENDGTVTSPDGVPPQHIWCIVEGATDDVIADVIYRRKAGGIGTFGADSGIAYSSVTGQAFVINFERPLITPAYITVTLSAGPQLPSDYVALVRTALVDFGENIKIGDDLILNRLFTPASIAIGDGSYVASITIGTAPNPTGTANLIAGTSERFQISEGNINVLL